MLVLADQARQFGKFENVSIENLKEMLDVNVYQNGFLSRLLIDKFYKRRSFGKRSAIIFLSSIQSFRFSPGSTIFSAEDQDH